MTTDERTIGGKPVPPYREFTRPADWMFDNDEQVNEYAYVYRIYLHEFDTTGLLIQEYTQQDALDAAIDIAWDHGWAGVFRDPEEMDPEAYLRGDYIVGGNWCLPIDDTHMRMEDVTAQYRAACAAHPQWRGRKLVDGQWLCDDCLEERATDAALLTADD